MISVLLPVRNGEKFICEAVRSVLFQTYRDFELLIINDGSTDHTLDILKAFDDDRILIYNTGGVGLVKSLNFGISKCNGSFIARMDADDICMANRFEVQMQFLKNNNEIGVVCSDVFVVNEDGDIIGQEVDSITDRESLEKGLRNMRYMKPIIHPTVMIRAGLLKEIGGYRDFEAAEDKDLWLRLISSAGFYRIPDKLLLYRVNPMGVSRSKYLVQHAKGLSAILNFEIWKEYGLDLFLEFPELLKSFEKKFICHSIQLRKGMEVFDKKKREFRSASSARKLLVLLQALRNRDVHSYFFLRRIKDRSRIEEAKGVVRALLIDNQNNRIFLK